VHSCIILGHVPAGPPVRNDGRWFAECRRCSHEIIREGGSWEPVPQGFRVIWMSREERLTRNAQASDDRLLNRLQHRQVRNHDIVLPFWKLRQAVLRGLGRWQWS
jgi:hypothetical protein